MNFFDTKAGSTAVLVVGALVAGYFVYSRISAFGKAATDNVTAVAKAVSDVTYQGATNLGQDITGNDSWSVTDLFPTSEAEKKLNRMLAGQ